MIEEYKDSPLGKVPVDWEVVKLEQVCLPKEGMRRGPFGGAIKKEFFVEKGYQVYEQRNAIYDDFVSARYFIDEEKYEELKAFQIQENDFIISCSGTIGKIAKVPKNYSKGVINQALLRLRLDRKKMYDDYFIQQFRDVPFQNKITDSVQGGAMKNLVGMSEFRKTLVSLPPLPEQQKIAEILSTVDDKIEIIVQQITQTQELKKGLMQRLLTKGIGHTEFKDSPLGMIPESWEVVKLEYACLPKEGVRRGPFGGAIKKESFVENGYQVYEQRNAIYDDFSTARYFIDEKKYEELKAFKVKANDFIISCSGTIGKIAKVPAIFKEGVINQALLRLRLKSSIIYDDFFLQQFRFEPFQNKITDSTQGGAMKNLVGMSEFRKTFIVLPPITEQKIIASILTLVDDKLKVLGEKKIHYQKLKRGLMQQLLTGKIRVKV